MRVDVGAGRRTDGVMGLVVGLALAGATLGCGRSAAPVLHPDQGEAARDVVRIAFSAVISARDAVFRPIEHSSVAVDHSRGILLTGGRDMHLEALSLEDGRFVWEVELPGALASAPTVVGDHVVLATEEGVVLALHLDRHVIEWTYETGGTVRRPVVVHRDSVYLVTSRQQVMSLSLASGEWQWQYGHDLPKEMTIAGQSGLRLDVDPEDPDDARVYVGFDDGDVVALTAENGQVLWIATLPTPPKGGFADADGTPWVDRERGIVFASAQDTGVHGISIDDGTVLWTTPMRGAGAPIGTGDGSIIVASALQGLYAIEPNGRVRWRRQLDPGSVVDPIVIGHTVLIGHGDIGVLAFESDTGDPLLRLDIGNGVDGPLAHDPVDHRVYFVSERERLFALELADEGL